VSVDGGVGLHPRRRFVAILDFFDGLTSGPIPTFAFPLLQAAEQMSESKDH
jgi:hypothetical protein